MMFSSNELIVLKQMAYGKNTAKQILEHSGKNYQSINSAVRKLTKKEAIILNGTVKPVNTPHILSLIKLLSNYPTIIEVIANSGIDILANCIKPTSVSEISKKTGFNKVTVHLKLKKALSMSIVKKEGSLFSLNEKLWPELVDFLQLVKTYENNIFSDVPPGSVVHKKRGSEILYSFKGNAELPSVKTAFSLYSLYGIKINPVTNYYRISKKQNLSIDDIFLDSIDIAESLKSERCFLFLILFYLKHKKQINIRKPVIQKIELALSGREIEGFPSLNEIKEKARVYEIKA